MNINHQMTERYGITEDYVCKECGHMNPETKYCDVAKKKVLRFWVACGKFKEREER